MNKKCTIQLFLNQAWQDVAQFTLLGPEERGWEAHGFCSYLLSHALDWVGAIDAHACSASFPVGISSWDTPTWPAFLMDLLPQGYGRQELLRQIGLSPLAEQRVDWFLLLAGAGNPIGNMRIKEAAEWLSQQQSAPLTGFTRQQIAERDETFLEYLAQHGLFVAGSSGVQGEWPKILLTEADDGLFYLDHTLPDNRAKRHWLVKFSRGQNKDLATILAAEAPYMQLAESLGLRTFAPLECQGRCVFIPRFDREVCQGKVLRHAQESLASLCQRPGFGVTISHNEAIRALTKIVSDPLTEVVEYIKRDIANVVLGNRDNHARNTAIQRRENGFIGLTPLYDFAPMWLHPDGIVRSMRWEQQDAGQPNWQLAIQQAAEASGLAESSLIDAIRTMAPALANLPNRMKTLKLPTALVTRHEPFILQTAQVLERLP